MHFLRLTTLFSMVVFATVHLAAQGNPPPEQTQYSWTVKAVCSGDDFPASAKFGDAPPNLPPFDQWLTSVNLYNPGPRRIGVRRWITTAPSIRFGPSVEGERGIFFLDPGGAIALDCPFMASIAPEESVGGEAFLLLETEQFMDVVAVYTLFEKTGCAGGGRFAPPFRDVGTDCKGAAGSVDVEHIQPKIKEPPPALPDLKISFLGDQREECDQGGRCFLTVSYLVENASRAPVRVPFVIELNADGHFTAFKEWATGLGPGARIALRTVLGPGRTCFEGSCIAVIGVDAGETVPESNEMNNFAENVVPRP